MDNYKLANKNGYSYFLVVTDNVVECGWRVSQKNEYAQAITNEVSTMMKQSRHKPNLIETDNKCEYINNFFNKFLKQNSI